MQLTKVNLTKCLPEICNDQEFCVRPVWYGNPYFCISKKVLEKGLRSINDHVEEDCKKSCGGGHMWYYFILIIIILILFYMVVCLFFKLKKQESEEEKKPLV
uniref:Uncharacterized protein n=1 Tax=Panagrolaimus sp. PS1159 TaxID=55785 RepID=A0AC35F426_9BILA